MWRRAARVNLVSDPVTQSRLNPVYKIVQLNFSSGSENGLKSNLSPVLEE